jgi:hypothetical protein
LANANPIIEKVKRINGGTGAKLEEAYNDLQAGDVVHGLYKAEDYCGYANTPELKEGCQLLKGKIKELGAENVPPYRIAQDYESFEKNKNPQSLEQYEQAKQQLAQMRTAYGNFQIFDEDEKALAEKLPALKKADAEARAAIQLEKERQQKQVEQERQKALAAEQARLAKFKADKAAYEARKKKDQEEQKRIATMENSAQCKAIRSKRKYCIYLALREKTQMNIDRENEVGRVGGYVNKAVLQKNASMKVHYVGKVKSMESEYQKLTSKSLSPAICKLERDQNSYQVNLPIAVSGNLEAQEKKVCGRIEAM